ncbi:Uncharacterised protein [Vibrio cholerae]|nr:Uncharacterised protein [Vibrio cholerae]CSI89077.1 Uncharacterised protein [Vibrio cholerae]
MLPRLLAYLVVSRQTLFRQVSIRCWRALRKRQRKCWISLIKLTH